MSKAEKLALIKETHAIAIMRAQSAEQLLAAAEAIHAGGVRVIEVTERPQTDCRSVTKIWKRGPIWRGQCA